MTRNLCVGLGVVIGMALPVVAMGDDSDLCARAAQSAAQGTGVPFQVLMALALTETGRGRDGAMTAWPWAVHHDGQGHWFESQDQAITFAEAALREGATNIDLGCFQLNIRWHARAFTSVADMISPENNARYAAEFLAQQFRESGDWGKAAGAYHSKSPDTAASYRAKFETILAGLDPAAPDALPDPEIRIRDNRFPLLRTGAPGGIGSLVPVQPAGMRLVGG